MTDNLSKQDRRKNMSAIRSTHSKLETKVSTELWARGYRFRKNVRDLKGKPDVAIKKYKVVIFIDSCFWHGCKHHGNIPKTNQGYWTEKLHKNKIRDKEVSRHYIDNDWNIMRVWEHEIKEDFDKTLNGIVAFIDRVMNQKQ